MAARKAIDILKAQNYTDAEIAEINPRLLKAIENEEIERDRLATEHARLTKDVADNQVWYQQTALPALNKALNDATTAKAEEAKYRTKLQAAQEYGLAKVADDQDGTDLADKTAKKTDDGAPDSRYVTTDVFAQTADQFGTAIAMATDIAEEYRELHGKRIPGGVTALRNEFIEARNNSRFKGTMQDYADQKFGFSSKREELNKAARQKELDDYANEKVMAARSEMGNPMSRALVQSRNPFTQKVQDGGSTATGKQPWEKGTVEQRRGERVVAFSQKIMQKVG